MFLGSPPPEDDEGGSKFERYDLQMLVAYGTIAWAFAASIGLALYSLP